MARVRDVLRHVRVEIAERKRTCHRKKGEHEIQSGELCLGIYEGSPLRRRNYCRECATPILALAGKQLGELHKKLGL